MNETTNLNYRNISKIQRGYAALRLGRFSQTGVDYFLTLCLQRPQAGLTKEPLLGAIFTEIHHLEASTHWTIRTAVVMPDHLHLLATVGEGTNLSETLRLFKGRLSVSLRNYGLRWQPSFYDHRLRSAREVLPTFLYIFLNPYHDSLLHVDERWPGYYCAKQDWEWFKDLTSEETPFPEWLL